MPTVVSNLPLWLVTLTIIALFVGIAGGGLVAVRRLVLPRLNIGQGDAEYGGAMLQAILVFYALAIALVAVSTWEQHSAIADQCSREAAAISSLYRQSLLLPDDVRDDVQSELVEYATFIVDEAWPQQARGEVPESGNEYITDIEYTLGSFEPKTLGMQNVQAEALDTFRDIVELRGLRLDAVGGHLAFAMWSFVLLGAAIAVLSSFFFVVRDARLHLILVTLLATIIGMVVVLIAAYDSPFVGDLAVPADSYQLVIDAAASTTATER